MKRKRYLSAEQVLDDIDAARNRAELYFKQAEEGDRQAKIHYAKNEVTEGHRATDLAHKRRRRAMNILDNKLPFLAAKLSEILTPQLQGVDNGDSSIPTN